MEQQDTNIPKRTGRTPRIGRTMQEARNEVAQQVALNDDSAEQITPEEIERREAEKVALLAVLAARGVQPIGDPAPVVAVQVTAGANPLMGSLTALAGKAREADDAVSAARAAEAETLAGPLLAEAQSLQTKHGALASTHLARVSEMAALPWNEIVAATPPGWTFDTKLQMNISHPHRALRALAQAAADARTVLVSTFGDSAPGKGDIDPFSVSSAVSNVKAIMAHGTHEPVSGELSQDFKRGLNHLRVWVARARNIVDAAEAALARFEKYSTEAQALLANVTPREVAPTPGRDAIHVAAPSNEYKQQFAKNFEPRSIMREEPEPWDGVTVTKVEGGMRVTGTRGEV